VGRRRRQSGAGEAPRLKERASLAGPNPYPLHSFLELRKIMGRAYVVCRPCRRFVAVGAWLDGRDTRDDV